MGVRLVKRKLVVTHHLENMSVQLCTNNGAIVMHDEDKLMDYDLKSDVTMVLVDELSSNIKLKLSFNNPDDMAYESVENASGKIENPEEVSFVDTDGRTGIRFTGNGVLKLPTEIELKKTWTISV